MFLFLAPPIAQGIIDTNTNGVSDLWEQQYNDGELILYLDLQADPDGDGWTNAQEAAAGTDPDDANLPNGFIRPETQHIPTFWGDDNGQPVIITPESFNLTWPLTTGKQYTLQFSFDLTAGSWITLGSPFIADATVPTYYFPVADAPKRFWRVAVTDVDTDNDELTNAEEAQLGTNPNNPDTDGDGVSDGVEASEGTNPSNASSYSLAWRRVERNLDYDFTFAAPPQTSTGTLALSALWDSALNTSETLSGPIPFTTLKTRLEAISFPGALPTSASTGLSPSIGNASIPITNVLNRNATLKHQRIWLTRSPTKDYTIAKKTVVFTDKSLNGVKQPPIFELKTFTLPANQTASNSVDLEDGFTSDGPSNGSSAPPGPSNIALAQDHEEKFTKQLVPVQVDDNQAATGVDNVSITASTSDIGYQEKFWIMAPTGNDAAGNTCSNDMKFNIPYVPDVEMEIVPPQAPAPTATPDPTTFNLTAASPCNWKGAGTVTADLDVTWKLGLAGSPAGPKQSVELPIGVKTMKRRTVKVAVYAVRCKTGNRPVPMPERALLEGWLNKVFAYQVNAWFQVVYKPQSDYDYDANNDSIAPYFTVLVPMIQSANYQDASQDIRIFVIDSVSLRELSSNDPDLNGFASKSPPAAIVNAGLPGMPARATQQVMETIAHEIGHVMVGAGHPDENSGFAPLLGTDRSQRLMSTLVTRASGAKLLVKTEWDNAEEWLRNRSNGDN
jgi:hypothetical protein